MNKRTIVDVDDNARLVSGVDARNRDRGSWVSVTTVDNLDLGAADVPLSATGARSRVKSNILNSDEVLTGGKGLGQSKLDTAKTRGWPADRLSTVGDGRDFMNLEPLAVSVPVSNIDTGRCFRHVDVGGTGVRDAPLGSESNPGAS